MRSLRTFASIVGAFGLLSGCTALLGSFEVQGGGPDAAGSEAGGGGDGPVTDEASADAAPDAPPLLLSCSVNNSRTRLIDTAIPNGGGGQLSFDNPRIFHMADGKVRVVARPPQSKGFTVYQFSPQDGGNPPQILDVPSGRVYDVTRAADGIVVLTTGTNPNEGRLEVHRIADAGFADLLVPLTGPGAVNEASGQGGRGPQARIMALGPQYFYAFTSAPTQIGPFDMVVGRWSGGITAPHLVFTSNDPANPASPRALIPQGPQMFIPLESNNNGPPTATDKMLSTPSDGTGTATPPRSLGRPGGKPNLFFASGPSGGMPGGAQNLAFLEVDTMSSTPLAFRLGAVQSANLGSFVAEDIPVSFTLDSVTRLPADGGDALWEGDHFLATGKGMGVPGINFLWYDTKAKALRGNQTGPDTLLKDHATVRRSSTAFSGTPTPIFTQLDLVFTEGSTLGDGSITETLSYTQIDCLH